MALKIILVGDSEVGKTALLSRKVNKYNPPFERTFAASFQTWTDQNTKLEVWDTAGDERYFVL